MKKTQDVKNYIRAMAKYVAGSQNCELLLEDIKKVNYIFKFEKRLLTLLGTRVISQRDKKSIIENMSRSMNLERGLVNFINLLVQQGYAKSLPKILAAALKEADTILGIKNGLFFTPLELSDEIKKDALLFSEKESSSKIRPQFIVDKDLISGLVIKIENKMYDFSLKNQLSKLKREILIGG